jgi:hypothetical protein
MRWQFTSSDVCLQWSTMLASLILTACAARPLEQGRTARELRSMLANPPACDTRPGLGGWAVDAENCAKKGAEERTRIREALVRLHAVELAAAPECVRAYQPSPESLRASGISPGSADAVPELLSRGLFVGSLANGECGPAVCVWRERFDPGVLSPYCQSGSATP